MGRSSQAPGVAVAAAAAGRVVEDGDLGELGAGDRAEDELGDAVPGAHEDLLLPVVDEQDLDLAAVVAVNGAGAVEDGHAVAQGPAGAGPHLAFEASGDGELQ